MEVIDTASRLWSGLYVHPETPKYLEKFKEGILKCGVDSNGIYIELDRSVFTSDFFLVNRIFPSTIDGLRNKSSLAECHIVCGSQEIELSPIEHVIGELYSKGHLAKVYTDSHMAASSTPERLAKDFMLLVRAEAVNPLLRKITG
jgi:hypothetical protein